MTGVAGAIRKAFLLSAFRPGNLSLTFSSSELSPVFSTCVEWGCLKARVSTLIVKKTQLFYSFIFMSKGPMYVP